MLVRKPHLMLLWFLPIYISANTVSFSNFGYEYAIKYLQITTILIGACIILLNINHTKASRTVFCTLFLLLINMLYSNIHQYQIIIFYISYALLVHIITKRNPHEIWSQYYLVCIIISLLSILDLISYFTFGNFIISYRNPEVIGFGLPRINSIFDEMSHQAFFLMPATLFCIINKSQIKFLLLVALLATMSVSALLLFFLILVLSFRHKLRRDFKSLFPIFIITFLAVYFAADFILGKMSSIFYTEAFISGEKTKQVSAINILLGIEVLKSIRLGDFLFGFGYFSSGDNIKVLLIDSPLYSYFEVTGSLEYPQSVGLLNLLFYFGLIQCLIFAIALFNARRYSSDVWLYKISMIVVILSMVKNSHTIEYLVHLFFVFGLAWARTNPNIGRKSELTRALGSKQSRLE